MPIGCARRAHNPLTLGLPERVAHGPHRPALHHKRRVRALLLMHLPAPKPGKAGVAAASRPGWMQLLRGRGCAARALRALHHLRTARPVEYRCDAGATNKDKRTQRCSRIWAVALFTRQSTEQRSKMHVNCSEKISAHTVSHSFSRGVGFLYGLCVGPPKQTQLLTMPPAQQPNSEATKTS